MKKLKVFLTTIAVFFIVLGATSLIGKNVKAADPLMAYAWNAYRGGTSIPEGSIKLDIPDGNITLLNAESSLFMSGGDFVEDTLYMVDYPQSGTSNLYTVNTATGVHTLIGNTNVGLHGFTYDVTTETAYGIMINNSLQSFLYSINLTTGASTLIGQINNGMIIGIAADGDGNLFGIDLGDDNLYSINKTTGAGTLVGSLGVDINYAQDICFDRDSGKLYGALYTYTGGLYEINISTGAATLLTPLDAEIDAFAIPYYIQEYTVSASADKAGAGSISGAGTFDEGTEVTLTATANPGYLFVNWTEDSTEVSTDATYTFDLTEDRVLVANFEAIPEYTVSASLNKPGAGSISGTGTFLEGTEVTLTATGNPGHVFVNWTEDGTEVSTDPSYTFNLNEDRELIANFKVPVTGITLNKNNVTLRAGGDCFKLIPTFNPLDPSNQELIWTSSNNKIAKVSADGTVSPLAVGTAIIRVTTVDGEFVAESVITVLAKDSAILPITGLLPAALMMSGMMLTAGTAAIIGYRKIK